MKYLFSRIWELKWRVRQTVAVASPRRSRARVINPYGVLHGGITFTLADTGMGIAVFTLMSPDERTTTVECSMRYLLPAKSGRIVAECRVIRRSNRFAITEAEVFDEAGQLLAVAGGSFYISRSKT